MSVLETPRVYFRGQITWDPMVTNNSPAFYDLRTSKPIFNGMSVAEYRDAARDAVVNGGNWNPDGTHRSELFETTVTGVDSGAGLDTTDAFVGVPVSFSGMLVDLDPYGVATSQLFFDEMSWGIVGGCRILGVATHRMTASRINFARNTTYRVIAGVASVVWQTSFDKSAGLRIDSHNSAVLDALNRALDHDEVKGLTVRMNTYRTVYYGTETPAPADSQALRDALQAGGFHPNPARSVLVGVVGLWRQGEAEAVPGDRVLLRTENSPVSTAFAKLKDDRLVIDLGNSVSETGFDLTKEDLGTLQVVAKTTGGDIGLGELSYSAYNKAAYEATSGLVELMLDSDQQMAARDADIEIRRATGDAVLTEQPLLACADRPNVYLEPGEQRTVTIRVFERGGSPQRAVNVTASETPASPLGPVVITTDDDGVGTVELTGSRAGEWTWLLLPWQNGQQPTVPGRLTPDLDSYFSMRTLSADDDIASMEPTWENVHHYVLRDWEALAPCMDNWLRLGDEQQCRAFAPLIRRLTSLDYFERYRYMPVTRGLTAGQRTLLHRWCDVVEGIAAPGMALARSTVRSTPDFGRGF